MESQNEYFVARSVSEFNLSGVGDLALPGRRTYYLDGSSVMTLPKQKMVTFEDEARRPRIDNIVI
jgi:hypothetical protein